MTRTSWFIILFALWILPYSITSATATESEEIVLVDEIIVTGSRLEQQNEKIPAQITVITAEQIRASGAQTVPDALRNLGGVTVRDGSGNGLFQTIDMGGFGETAGRHVAIVVNGRKINPIDQSSISFASIPVENVERIEVLYGGNSVLYGSDAMGGVINIITKEAQEGFHANVEAAGGSYETMKGTADVSFTNGKFGARAGAVHYETDGYRDRSKGRRQSAYGKLSFYGSDAFGVHFEANATDLAYQYPGSLSEAQFEDDPQQAVNQADEGESQEKYYVLTLNSDWGKFGRLDIDLSYKDYQRQDLMTSWFSYFDYDYNTCGANPQYVLDGNIFGKENRLTIGFEYYDTDYDAWNGPSNTKIATTTFDHSQKTGGVYIQDEFNLMEKLVMNLGARYEEYETNLNSSMGDQEEVDDDEWAWNTGLSYIFSPGSKVFARAYQAFRIPKVDDYTDVTTGAVNEELKHETSMGYEVGLRLVTMEKRLATNLRLYTFDVDDEIFYKGIWPAGQNENLDETRHQGGEIDMTYKMTDLVSLFGSLGYTDATFQKGDNTGKTIPLVPELKGHAGFSLTFDFGMTYRCQYNYLGSRYQGGDEANTQDKLDAANTFDMYLSYNYKQVEFFANATNIFNEKYASTSYSGYYYPAAEAIYFGGVRMKF